MERVTVSPKFQVVIPLSVRTTLKISPGEKIRIPHYRDRIEFIPEKKLKTMRGFLKGIDTTVKREKDRV